MFADTVFHLNFANFSPNHKISNVAPIEHISRESKSQNQSNYCEGPIRTKKTSQETNENSRKKLTSCLKRGKTRVTESWLVLVFWLTKRVEFFRPITGRSKAKTVRFRITFDTQPRISPIVISPSYHPCISQLTHIVLLHFQVLFYSIPLGFDSVYLLH